MKRMLTRNRLLAALAVCGLAGMSLASDAANPAAGKAAEGPTPAATRPAAGKLVVHEWGTFTGFAGSDGAHLSFNTTVGADLPPFVLNRTAQARRQQVPISIGFLLSKGGGLAALQRMETPVIYFYADRPRDVSVRVDFPQGLLTEFYPPVKAMAPAFGEGPGEAGAVERELPAAGALPTTRPAAGTAKLARGSLDWGTVRVVPQGVTGGALPEVPVTPGGGGHYAFARETDAATVRFTDAPGHQHDERFLFYRGLGDFALPVTLTAAGGDRFELNSAGPHPVRWAVLIRSEGGRARFAVHRDLSGRRPMTLPAETAPLERVGDAVAAALVAEGLYEKEARAMVKTWSANWLGEPGTRVLYTVPRPVTDDLLPLHVAPAPDETVRVLVGRIDVMSPEQEQALDALLAAAPQAASLPPEDVTTLATLGRFYDAAVARVAKLRGRATAETERRALWTLYVNGSRTAKAAASATP